MTSPSNPLPDARKANWVDRRAPEHLRPWLRLGRFDRPIGIWLLFLPCAMGLAFAYAHPFFVNDPAHPGTTILDRTPMMHFPYYKLLLFAVGAALMRAAGCAYNDYVDRDIDARVERTRGRPIPSGQIKPKQALIFACVCSLISFGILLQLGWMAILLGLASIGLVAAYPFMKRITWWPQAWLGLTFNWGFLMAVATVTDGIGMPALIFYAGLIFWTLGYDTIYALQDIEDDTFAGVKSSARALGKHAVNGVSLFYGLAVLLTGLSGYLLKLTPYFFGGLLLVTAHLLSQVVRMRLDDSAQALRLFKANQITGLLWVMSLVAVHISL